MVTISFLFMLALIVGAILAMYSFSASPQINGSFRTNMYAYGQFGPVAQPTGATVELDQKVYTWTDRVYITVVAPAHNTDPNLIDAINVAVSTRGNTLSPYKLVETGPDTGIFIGYVILTGDEHIIQTGGVDGSGTQPRGSNGGTFPSGHGPTDGFIPAEDSDGVSVSFEFTRDQTVTGSALIRWNIGEVKWLEASYPANGQGVLQIVDPDMNLDPKAVDKFDTNVWSDSDSGGIKLTMTETGEATGIFQGTVNFITSGSSSGNRLQVALGDIVTAEYRDRTLPAPYTPADQLRLTSTTFIGKVYPITWENFANATISFGTGASNACATQLGCFDPIILQVRPGTTVTWKNNDTSSHTVTSGTPSTPAIQLFDSGLLHAGNSFSYTFNDAGNYPYFDLIHPWMTGEVKVIGVGPRPENATESTPHINKTKDGIIFFPRVLRSYDDGSKYFTDPRPYDDTGRGIPTEIIEGKPLSNFVLPTPLCVNASLSTRFVGLHQEGGWWHVDPGLTLPDSSRPGWGFSINWTMPSGTVKPGGGYIFFNPVNINYTEGSVVKKYFQVDYGFGNAPNGQHNWFWTVIDSVNTGMTGSSQFDSALPVWPETSYRIDAWLQTYPLAYPSVFVAKVTYHNSAHQLEAKEFKEPIYSSPSGSLQIQGFHQAQISTVFESFNDEFLQSNADLTMNRDKLRDPYVGVFEYTKNVPSHLLEYDPNRVHGFDRINRSVPSPDVTETYSKLAPESAGNGLDNVKQCESLPRISNIVIEPPPPTGIVSHKINLKATVTDVDVNTPTAVNGIVSWSHAGNGNFDSASCNLRDGSCRMGYTPTTNALTTITATYSGKDHSGSSYTAIPFTPSSIAGTHTVIDPHSPSGVVGTSITLTAEVTMDTGTPITGGTVTWSNTGSGNFDSTSCTLSSGGNCTVQYTPSKTDSTKFTATYNGDANHDASSGVTSSFSPICTSPPCCLIATAAFGSEVTPQIQFLIDFRDHRVMSTLTGSSFMTVANAWYYSFSPYVADYERQHSWFKETVKASIYPLLGIFMLAEKPYSSINGDLGTLTSGLIASSLIGVVYLWPIAIAIKHVRNNRFNPKVAIALVAVVFMSVLLATLSANQYALMITTPLSFLLILSISSVLTARMISKITRRLSKKNSTDTTTYHSSHKSMGV